MCAQCAVESSSATAIHSKSKCNVQSSWQPSVTTLGSSRPMPSCPHTFAYDSKVCHQWFKYRHPVECFLSSTSRSSFGGRWLPLSLVLPIILTLIKCAILKSQFRSLLCCLVPLLLLMSNTIIIGAAVPHSSEYTR